MTITISPLRPDQIAEALGRDHPGRERR